MINRIIASISILGTHMRQFILLALLLPLSGISQHYDRKPNLGREIPHYEHSEYELYASDLIYGRPDESGLSHPIYRIESIRNYLYKVVDIASGSILNTYSAGGSVSYSRFGKYWVAHHSELPDYISVSEAGKNGANELYKSDIFHDGDFVAISELTGQYVALYSGNMLNSFSLGGNKNWTYRYPFGDINADEIFLSSDESILIINHQGIRVLAVDMFTGNEIWRFDGQYSAAAIPFQLSPNVLLYDEFYGDTDILSRTGSKLYHIEKMINTQAEPLLYNRRLVYRNIVIPNLPDDESRVILPSALISENSGVQVSPITWSTEGSYFTRTFVLGERADTSDSTEDQYRIDVVSATGTEMGYFYPKIRSKLTHTDIKVQISNDGTRVLFTGKEKEGVQFICREYVISL